LWKQHASNQATTVVVPVQGVSDLQGPIDTLLVTTKSYQAKDAVQSVLNHSNIVPSRVILLCNGALSVRDELLAILKEDIPLILATTTHGAYHETGEDATVPGFLVHAGMGQTFLQEEATDLMNSWNKAGLKCSTLSLSEMEHLLWKKLAANCVINPLTALFRCKNGELLMEPAFYELQQQLLREVSLVAKASIELGSDALNEEILRQFVQDVIHDTGENRSSMLQDVMLGKKTEIDHLNNYIVRKGRALGIECPTNEDLVSRILELH
jgi:2-dehydropantoate 2-reductase